MRSDEVLNERFRATRFANGYDQEEVDKFLDQVILSLRSKEAGEEPTHPQLTAQMVHDVRFTQTRFREGYHPADVDAFLERVAAAFSERER